MPIVFMVVSCDFILSGHNVYTSIVAACHIWE